MMCLRKVQKVHEEIYGGRIETSEKESAGGEHSITKYITEKTHQGDLR